jgi:tetratricopeptide (TPR) repeat protein
LHPPEDPNRAKRCNDLAASLQWQLRFTDDSALIEEVVQLHREALALRPPGHPDRHVSCSNLAEALQSWFGKTGDFAVLDESVHLHREALALRPPDHPSRDSSCNGLATLLNFRFMFTGDHTILEEAIHLHREALELRQKGHSQRAQSCDNLASALATRFRHTGDGELLDEAIQLQREALDLRPAGHMDRHHSCNNLASVLEMRHRQINDSILLNEIVDLYREALVLRPPGHPNRQNACTNLATALETRFDETGEWTLLRPAIALRREALALYPAQHPERGRACNNLAALLDKCFDLTSDPTLLDEAIQLHREALSLIPSNNPHRADSYTNLAGSIRKRVKRYGNDDAALDEIFGLLEVGLALRPADHPNRWRSLMELATVALMCHKYTDAIDYLKQALCSATYDTPDMLKCTVNIVNEIPIDGISTNNVQSLLQSCMIALDLVVLATGLALDHLAQLHQILKGSALGPRALLLANHAGELSTGLGLLERARGVIWAETLHMRNPDVSRIPDALAKQLEAAMSGASGRQSSGDVSESSHGFLSERDRKYEQRSQLQHILREIRSMPGLDDFMHGPDSTALLAVAAQSPVVVLVAFASECHAVVIASPDEPLVDIVMEGIDTQALQNLTFASSRPQKRGSSPTPHDTRLSMMAKGRISTSEAALAKIWQTVVKPIFTHLGLKVGLTCNCTCRYNHAQCAEQNRQGEVRPRIHWCPTGVFAFVPVHAAGIYAGPNQECCSDYVVSSYTPTLSALLRARLNSPTYATDHTKLLVVAAEHAQDPSLPTLKYVAEETRNIYNSVAGAGVSITSIKDTSTKPEVIEALELTHLVHFACHGVQVGREPHESHFCLQSDNLTVEELMQTDLRTSFCAFLSACETAKGDRQHADEAVHLAAAMLFAGFKSVVATMW